MPKYGHLMVYVHRNLSPAWSRVASSKQKQRCLL